MEAQRFWADALATEYQAIVTYNNAIAGWEYGKGTILQHDNVTISEGPIPQAAQKRAVEHLRERTKALVLRERAAPTGVLANPLTKSGPVNLIPQINAQSLPSVWKDMPPIADAESLPPPDKIDTGAATPLLEAGKDQVFPPSELPGGASTVPLPASVPTTYAPSSAASMQSHLPPRKPSDSGALRPVNDPAREALRERSCLCRPIRSRASSSLSPARSAFALGRVNHSRQSHSFSLHWLRRWFSACRAMKLLRQNIAKKIAEYMPPLGTCGRSGRPLEAISMWTAKRPATTMEIPSETAMPRAGMSAVNTSRLICPPSSGQMGSKLSSGQK